MQNHLKKHAEKLRFAVVGGLNTTIDFVVLFVLVGLGLPVLTSNYISTTIALIFSFFANKTFTFTASDKPSGKHFIYFILITLVGLWIIQPIIIQTTSYIIGSLITNKDLVLLIGKLLATFATLVWNYLLYRKFVFKNNHHSPLL